MQYEPLTSALEFHESNAAVRLLVGDHRAGKTTAALADLVMAATADDRGDGEAYVVGVDTCHIEHVIAPTLLQMIPSADISCISWVSRRRGIPDEVRLKTGWLIRFVSSCRPLSGVQADYAIVSEPPTNESVFRDLRLGCALKGGRLVYEGKEFGAPGIASAMHPTSNEAAVFRMAVHDNTHLSKEAVRLIKEFAA